MICSLLYQRGVSEHKCSWHHQLVVFEGCKVGNKLSWISSKSCGFMIPKDRAYLLLFFKPTSRRLLSVLWNELSFARDELWGLELREAMRGLQGVPLLVPDSTHISTRLKSSRVWRNARSGTLGHARKLFLFVPVVLSKSYPGLYPLCFFLFFVFCFLFYWGKYWSMGTEGKVTTSTVLVFFFRLQLIMVIGPSGVQCGL